MSEYFTLREMACRHCGLVVEDPEFTAIMDTIRQKYGKPIIVTSWTRCEEYDKFLGGKGNHPTGRAVDIVCKSSKERKRLMLIADKSGINRIGVGSNFLHLDILDRDGSRVEGVWWHYRR